MAEGGIRRSDKRSGDSGNFDLKDIKKSLDAQAPFDKGPDEELRVILVGKVGVGKSSTANTLTSSSLFTAGQSSVSVTKHSRHAWGNLKDRDILVIDTPGLFDTAVQNTTQHVKDEIKSCMHIGAPGVHAIVFVLSAAMRFSKEDKRCFEEFCSIFGQDFFEYAIVAFTWADQLLNYDQTLDQYIGENFILRNFLEKCGNRVVSINNCNPKPLEKEIQLNHFFNTIMLMHKANSYKYYTDELFKDAEKEMQRREQVILEKKQKEKVEEISKIKHYYNEKYKNDIRKMEKRYNKKRQKIIDEYNKKAREIAREEFQKETNARGSKMCILM